ncbi:MAG: hypothetical protein P9L99_01185 [Candidatus Lernaella stagnicola]|nr:hypothetical protein [Candidatus Lernaella stagnicola]
MVRPLHVLLTAALLVLLLGFATGCSPEKSNDGDAFHHTDDTDDDADDGADDTDDDTDDDADDTDDDDNDTDDDDDNDDDDDDNDNDDDDDAAENAIAVGGSEGSGPVAWVRTAKGWKALVVPGAPSLYPLRDVSAFDTGQALLVGGYGQFAEVYEFVDGGLVDRSFACYSSWQFGVSAHSASRAAGAGCFAHMGFTQSRIWIFDGIQFTQAPVTEPNANSMCIARDVWWVGPDEAVAVGRDDYTDTGILWSGDENGFALENAPFVAGAWELAAVTGCPDGRVVAVGRQETLSRGLVLVRRDGTWRKETLPSVSPGWELRGVSCQPTALFVVGHDAANGAGVVLRYAGSWSVETMPLPDGDWGLEAVAISPGGVGYAVGYDDETENALILRRYDGDWQPEDAPVSENDQPLWGVTILTST